MSADETYNADIPLFDSGSIHINKASSSGARAKTSNSKHKHNNHKKHSKSSSKCHLSVSKSPAKDKWMIAETPNPYSIGRKKRQNGDTGEGTANSKRTCLSDRFSLLNRNRKNIRDLQFHKHFNKDIKSTSTVSNLYEPTSMEPRSSFHISRPKIFTSAASSSLSKDHNIETPSSSSSSSSFSNLNSCFNKINALSDVFNRPSTSKYKQKENKQGESSAKQSNALGVSFIDSESEDSEPSTNITLSRNHQCSPPIAPFRKVIGRGLKKVLESDDDDEDDEQSDDSQWTNLYRRGVPIISSCSDDSSDVPIVPKKSYKKRHSLQLSSTDSNDGSSPSYNSHSYQSSTSKKSTSERTSDSSHSKSTFDHSYASRNVRDLTNSSSFSSTSLSNQSTSSSSSSSLSRNSRYPHRDSSNHQASPPILRSRSSRLRSRGISRSAISQMGNISHTHVPRTLEFAERYPDVFDNEESSDMEFFTANSYSDTEASLSNMDSSFVVQDMSTATSTRNRSNNTFSVSGSSPSEDEISVIFTSAFADSSNRRIRHRGRLGGRRRRNRISGCTTGGITTNGDVVSLSPDPVAQVRQVEEDEQLARRLQAQFDEEMNTRREVPHASDDSDFEDNDVAWESDSHAPPPVRPISSSRPPFSSFRPISSPLFPPQYAFPSNIVFLSQGGAGGGRRRRGRRGAPTNADPWMLQFARILGLNSAYTSPEESEYETLLQFAESVGGDIPRGLRKTEINRLPTRTFYFPGAGPSTSRGQDDVVHKRTELNKECQVCLSDYENGDILRILPCFHEFHTPCIDPWLKINHTCPVCRVEVAFED